MPPRLGPCWRGAGGAGAAHRQPPPSWRRLAERPRTGLSASSRRGPEGSCLREANLRPGGDFAEFILSLTASENGSVRNHGELARTNDRARCAASERKH